MLLFVALPVLFLVIALTRPGSNRLFRGRYRRSKVVRYGPLHPTRESPDVTAGLRDPARPL